MAKLIEVLDKARQCQLCAKQLPHAPRPVFQISAEARLLIIGQAPGAKVHGSGVPFDDPSGDRLRDWLGIDRETFYDSHQLAIMPMGFCYPGKGNSGDLPPRPECAPHWHEALLAQMPGIRLTLLIGQYAQRYYLDGEYSTLTETVKAWRKHLPTYFALPHPSPRNRLWLKRNPWFEEQVLPELKRQVRKALRGSRL